MSTETSGQNFPTTRKGKEHDRGGAKEGKEAKKGKTTL